MKTQKKSLHLKKIQIAKVNAFAIKGRGTTDPQSTVPCTIQESRTPKGGRTQTVSYDNDCPDTDI
ncbi:hypothetical protein [Kordia zhangzhouensis]|uniref:hypothetical protein n=1 Tax=Kordia zhangzhouensis TaxID=1620405 RepID=UPI000629450B|nr:hypothetical protein [Kordia zhangzhouensis]